MPRMSRKTRNTQIQQDMKASRIVNGSRKEDERARRDARMLELVKKGKLPFTPPVMSWLSVQLQKPSRLVTDADIKTLVK